MNSSKSFCAEDAVVLGKETEKDADQEALQFMPGVSARLQRIVQVAHELGGFEVRGVVGIEADAACSRP